MTRTQNTPGARRTSLGAETEELLNQRRNSDRALRLSDLDGEIADFMLKIAKTKGYITEIPEIADNSILLVKLAAAAIRLASEGLASPTDAELATAAWAAAYAQAYANTVGRVPLATKTAAVSPSLDFTEFNNSVYRRYEFELENVKPATDNVQLGMQVSTNAGSSYDAGAADYSWTYDGTGNVATTAQSAGDTNMRIATAIGNAANEDGVSGNIILINAGSLSDRSRILTQVGWENTATVSFRVNGGGRRLASQDTDAVRFLFSSGNISGTIRMFGIV